MDGFEEKKWFVYITDHHEGPFSLADIQAKMREGQVSSSHFVWCEGMGDWKMMKEVPAFEGILNAPPALPSAPPVNPALTPALSPTGGPEPTIIASKFKLDPVDANAAASPVIELSGAALEPHLGAVENASTASANDIGPMEIATGGDATGKIQLHGNDPAEIPATAVTHKKTKTATALTWVKIAIFPAILVGGGAAYVQGYLDPLMQSPGMKAGVQTVRDATTPALLKLADRFPALSKYVSPIPAIEDVNPEEYEELKEAARHKIDVAGPKLALAVSKTDILAPSFYIASNLPEGTVLDVYIEGIPDTLLNQLSVSLKTEAVIIKKLGKTPAIRMANGQALPRGEYMVHVTESEHQPADAAALLASLSAQAPRFPDSLPRGRKLLTTKTYFLSGNKDNVYAARLKEFHDKLLAKATAEITEVKQFASTIESQLGLSVSKFNELQGGGKKTAKSASAKRKAWDEFHAQWASLVSQMSTTMQKWTPEALQNEYFYGVLYQLTLQASQSVEAVHTLHNTYFTGTVDPKAFEIQVGQSVSVAQSAVATLKTKIEQAEKIPPSPNGMPRKDGL